MFIDTHTHLYLEDFGNGGADVVRRAIDAGVHHMIFPNVDLSTVTPMKALASKFPNHTSMAMGLHPTEVNESWKQSLEVINEYISDGSEYVAIGEIGMDLYWDKTFRTEQMQAFERQVQTAIDLDLPVIIHCREALDETLEVLSGFQGKRPRGVFHSFGGTRDDIEKIRDRAGDFYFGINGVVTFKNCAVRDSLATIGMERLLLETDSPYLAPVPHRGKRNESAFITHTAAYIAQHLDIPVERVAEATSRNAVRLFKL